MGSAFTETYDIPGYALYKGAVPRQVTLRAMTAKEERTRIAATSPNVIPQLIRQCMVDNDFDVAQLKIFDVDRLMYGLRTVTYGPEYPIRLRCPKCGKIVEVNFNLDMIPINYVPEDFEEPFTIGPLPVSGDVLTCKLPTMQDAFDIVDEKKRMLSRSPEMADPEFILSYTKKILSVNGEMLSPYEMYNYIEDMMMKDLRYFDCRYEEFESNFGLEKNLDYTCESCGSTFKFEVPMGSEFFRPEL